MEELRYEEDGLDEAFDIKEEFEGELGFDK